VSQSAFWTLPQALAWILRKDPNLVRWLAEADDVGALHRALGEREWDVDVDPPVERSQPNRMGVSDELLAEIASRLRAANPGMTAAESISRASHDPCFLKARNREEEIQRNKGEITEQVIVHGRRIGEEIEAAIAQLVDAARLGQVPTIDRITGKPVQIPPVAVSRAPVGYDHFWETVSFPTAQVMAKWKPGRTKVGQITIQLTAWLKEHPGSTKEEARDWFDSEYEAHPVHQFSKAWAEVPAHLKRSRGKRGPQKTPK
jgi:hypothetical protein